MDLWGAGSSCRIHNPKRTDQRVSTDIKDHLNLRPSQVGLRHVSIPILSSSAANFIASSLNLICLRGFAALNRQGPTLTIQLVSPTVKDWSTLPSCGQRMRSASEIPHDAANQAVRFIIRYPSLYVSEGVHRY